MEAKLHFEQFFEGMTAFYRLRKETDSQLQQFIDSMIQQMAVYPEIAKPAPANVLNQVAAPRKKTTLKNIIRFIRRIPLFFQQAKKMKQAANQTSVRESVILALASNRLVCHDQTISIRNFLSELVSDFSRESKVMLVDRTIELAPCLFICDPLRKSPLWDRYQACWDDHVFILDGEFLLFQAVMTVLKGKATTVFHVLSKGLIFKKPKQVMASALMLDAYETSFSKKQSYNAFLLSSNSFSIEILRLYLLQFQACKSVCEIMHGVPAIFYEQYLAGILEISEKHGFKAYEKHFSILNIPHLPLFGVLQQDVKWGAENAINTYLNNYLVNKKVAKRNIKTFIQVESRSLFQDKELAPNTLVMTFIGTVSSEKHFYTSRIFAIECFLMQWMMKKMQELKHPFLLFYAAHPANSSQKANNCEFFHQNNIALCPETILSWFFSDVSVSLFSAALFESAQFGVDAFTPVMEKDGIFPAELLEFLPFKKSNKDVSDNLIESLDRFIHFCINKPRKNHFERAENRLSSCC